MERRVGPTTRRPPIDHRQLVKTTGDLAAAVGDSVDRAAWIEEFEEAFARIAGRFYRCWAPHPVPLSTLVRIAVTRWAVEEAFQSSKAAVGLDQPQVRRWYRRQPQLIHQCPST